MRSGVRLSSKTNGARSATECTGFVTEDGAVTVADMLRTSDFSDTAPDAAALGCTAEIQRCRAISGRYVSDAQLAFRCAPEDWERTPRCAR